MSRNALAAAFGNLAFPAAGHGLHGFACPALVCAAWLMAGVAIAQPTSTDDGATDSTTVGPVVVQGRSAQVQRTFEKAVAQFLHDAGRPGPFGWISRWVRPVCPVTSGLTAAMNDFISSRIREVAARVGAPTAGDCSKDPDILVLFTTEPDKLMADVRKHHEGLLGYHYVGQTKSLAAFEPPMKSWYVTSTRIPGSDFVMLDRAYAPGPPGGTGSRIPAPLQSRFVLALVVIDARLVEGQAIGSVADRIAMLVLSKPASRTGCSALPSVMDFLNPQCPGSAVEELTRYDEAYLKALYTYQGDEMRSLERHSMGKAMVSQTSLAVAPPRPSPQAIKAQIP